MAGLIDWYSIEDRTRALAGRSHWDEPEDILSASASSFYVDHWKDQPFRIEVWIEKKALEGVFARVCRKWDIDYFSCIGYTSQSAMWNAAERLRRYARDGQTPLILHFGDHDPSGIDMTRDIVDRMETFNAFSVRLDRLALNMDQVDEYSPPPNPAKTTDSRFDGYIATYGEESWELDALEPKVLEAIVEDAVQNHIDWDAWDEAEEKVRLGKERLRAIADNFDSVCNHLGV
jgi:hypothetical protein